MPEVTRSGGRREGALPAVFRALTGPGFARLASRPSLGQRQVRGASDEWMACVDRWYATSTLDLAARRVCRHALLKAARWLMAEQPHIVTPADWTRETCSAWIAHVMRSRVGDYVQREAGLSGPLGRPLAPTTRANYISAVRIMLRDCQEWDWCPRRFDPIKALATPRSLHAMIWSQAACHCGRQLGKASLGGAEPENWRSRGS